MQFKFKFTRKRQIVEAGELSIDITKIDEKEIAEKLANLNFSTFLVLDVEPAAPDEWSFTPMQIKHDTPKPKAT